MKRRLRIRWTCSDYVSHSHRWRWSAWLCGRVQWLARDARRGAAVKRAAAFAGRLGAYLAASTLALFMDERGVIQLVCFGIACFALSFALLVWDRVRP
jgi:hypothetical protein